MLYFVAFVAFAFAVAVAMTHRTTPSERVADTFANTGGIGTAEMVRQGLAASWPLR